MAQFNGLTFLNYVCIAPCSSSFPGGFGPCYTNDCEF